MVFKTYLDVLLHFSEYTNAFTVQKSKNIQINAFCNIICHILWRQSNALISIVMIYL